MDAWHAGLDDQPMIEADSLAFSYENSRAVSLQLEELQVESGRLVVLCGASGSGKSTLLRLLNGLIPDYYEGRIEGQLRLGDLTAGQHTVQDFSRLVASVFQNPASQFFHKKLKHELVFPCENQGRPVQEIVERLDKLTQDFSLEDYLERDLFSLSGGEKQRVALLTAIMQDTPVLVLDEPTANLDRLGVDQVRDYLARMKAAGKTILVAEHRLDYLQDLADAYLYFDQGRLESYFSAADFLALSDPDRHTLSLRSLHPPAVPSRQSGPLAASKALTVRQLQLQAGGRKLAFLPELVFPAGAITAILGANGSGKSTLASYLAGLLDDSTASFELAGRSLTADQRLRQTALVMQEVRLQLFADSVEKELMLGNKSSKEERTAMLTKLGLAGMEERHPMTLSGGEQQRLLIASQLLSDKQVFIFDEPSSGLDYRQMRALADLLQDLKATGKIVILISHDQELLDLTADFSLELTKV